MRNELGLFENDLERIYTKDELLKLASRYGAQVIARENKIDHYKITHTYDDRNICWWKDRNESVTFGKVIIAEAVND